MKHCASTVKNLFVKRLITGIKCIEYDRSGNQYVQFIGSNNTYFPQFIYLEETMNNTHIPNEKLQTASIHKIENEWGSDEYEMRFNDGSSTLESTNNLYLDLKNSITNVLELEMRAELQYNRAQKKLINK